MSKLYISIRYLPEVFKTERVYRNGPDGRYDNETTRIRNPLWSDNLLQSCLNNQLMFRVIGETTTSVR
jgi:hypothetical protein